MHLRLDILGGIAGDMFIAAVLDAWPEHLAGTLAAIRAAGLPEGWQLAVDAHRDHTLSGSRFNVIEPPARGIPAFIAHPSAGRTQHHEHTPFRTIAERLRDSSLDASVAARAVAIFTVLARAEGEVHGVPVEDVTFHEVGAWDSVADIVGAAYLLEALKPDAWSVSAIPLGGGRIKTAHGPMPVPAPATARLLDGFTLVDDGIAGERVTPTGAAILRHLHETLGPPSALAPAALARSGTGFGTRVLPGISNVVRVLGFAAAGARVDDRVGVIEFEVDDQTAEDLAAGIDRLRARDGVLDVLQMPAFGKKGRLVAHLQVLCRHDALAQIVDACFLETTTLGLRWNVTSRTKLERAIAVVGAGEDAVSVKVALRPSGTTSAKAEAEDVNTAGGHAARQRARRRAERSALEEPSRGERWPRT